MSVKPIIYTLNLTITSTKSDPNLLVANAQSVRGYEGRE